MITTIASKCKQRILHAMEGERKGDGTRSVGDLSNSTTDLIAKSGIEWAISILVKL